ncbi:CDP-diacylglycerol--glycerol-3-phosphate 3-phosphatidyltransferase [Coriobacteriia bacterium Es71-Z0120]|uniref:CDP-diacylglycerol--glycerol-3-phosphate 3-phosphatidyltransferase n=1 Tax=Parvivirga hydrogeniphila TaxID=2939460 RepID=UPI0022608CD1|nr:CDP-diacylglycerol--glycerol-3-phosphate 3-phosphatidyltransferase [Parvivirga hydrogeniphila]MCL4079617.1 CDP-diacylglycerol--glycerol-3-phosphate 3-phosphatidyltransferase [Parvivirga hydrogeniphila]
MSPLRSIANRVTLARVVLIPIFLAILLAKLPVWGPWLAAAVFALLAGTDAVDGYLARSRNEVTTFGKFIDPIADKLLVTAALVALVELGRLPSWIAVLIISRELVVSGLRLVAVAEGRVIAASVYGKAKTVLQTVAILAFIVKDSSLITDVAGASVAHAFGIVAWVVMAAAMIATVASMVDYFYHARDILAGPWSQGGTDA